MYCKNIRWVQHEQNNLQETVNGFLNITNREWNYRVRIKFERFIINIPWKYMYKTKAN